ncbi:MAG: hypothetical protein AAB368_01570, partial [bacterium]
MRGQSLSCKFPVARPSGREPSQAKAWATILLLMVAPAWAGERTGAVVRDADEVKAAAFLNPGWVRVEAGEAGAVEAVLSALPPGTSALVTVEAARAGELAANFRGRVAAWQLGQRFEPS